MTNLFDLPISREFAVTCEDRMLQAARKEAYTPWRPEVPQHWGVYVAHVGIPGRIPYATGLDSEITAHRVKRAALQNDMEHFARITWKYIIEKEE